MNIAIITNTTWNIFNFRSHLVEGMIAQGYRVIAIAPPDEHVRAVEGLGAKFIPLKNLSRKGLNPLRELLLIRELARIYREEKVAFALHFTIKPVIYGTLAGRLTGTRSINTVTGLGYAFLSKGIVNRVVKKLYTFSLRYADQVFLQNQDDLQLFLAEKLSPRDRTSKIPGSGINTNHFFPRQKTSEGIHFLFIGRLLYDKGILEFVEAAKLVRQKQPMVHFHILGALDQENPAAIQAKELEEWKQEAWITYHGTTTDTRPFIANATAVVLPSYREGLPRVMLEAMAMAKPIITTDVPGCREVVPEGENGFLVKVEDADALAEAMFQVMNSSTQELERMGKTGRDLAVERFSEAVIVKRYLDLIQSPTHSSQPISVS